MCPREIANILCRNRMPILFKSSTNLQYLPAIFKRSTNMAQSYDKLATQHKVILFKKEKTNKQDFHNVRERRLQIRIMFAYNKPQFGTMRQLCQSGWGEKQTKTCNDFKIIRFFHSLILLPFHFSKRSLINKQMTLWRGALQERCQRHKPILHQENG